MNEFEMVYKLRALERELTTLGVDVAKIYARMQGAKTEELGLCQRTINVLKYSGIVSVRQLQGMTSDELLKVRNLGKMAAYEVIAKMEKCGVSLSDGPEYAAVQSKALSLKTLNQVRKQIGC